MTVAYFDSSALVKLVRVEAGSDIAGKVWDACSRPVVSRLGYVEVLSALAAARRRGEFSPEALRRAVLLWDELWSTTTVVELTPTTSNRAGVLAERHALSGADAVHLSSALVAAPAGLVMAVWDTRLREAALAEGLVVVPAA